MLGGILQSKLGGKLGAILKAYGEAFSGVHSKGAI